MEPSQKPHNGEPGGGAMGEPGGQQVASVIRLSLFILDRKIKLA